MTTLTDFEIGIVQGLVKKIAERGATDVRQGPQSSAFISFEGMAGEFAFCKRFNVFPDFATDGGAAHDCYVPGWGSVDVKATTRKDGRLVVKATKAKNPADWYALMIGQNGKYHYAGRIRGVDLFTDDNLVQLRPDRAPCYAVKQSRLVE